MLIYRRFSVGGSVGVKAHLHLLPVVLFLHRRGGSTVQSVNMVDSSVTRVERMAGYDDLLTAFRASNGVEDLF